MAIKPEELVLTGEELTQISNLEARMDATLRDAFVAGKVEYAIDNFAKDLPPRIVAEVKRRYEAVGWKFTIAGYTLYLTAKQ